MASQKMKRFLITCLLNRLHISEAVNTPQQVQVPEKTVSVCEFSLCLSRACLGKKITFINKWRKRTVFSPHADRFPRAGEDPGALG